MTFEELKRRLGAQVDVDIDVLYETYCAECDPPTGDNYDGFVAFLHERGIIDPNLVAAPPRNLEDSTGGPREPSEDTLDLDEPPAAINPRDTLPHVPGADNTPLDVCDTHPVIPQKYVGPQRGDTIPIFPMSQLPPGSQAGVEAGQVNEANAKDLDETFRIREPEAEPPPEIPDTDPEMTRLPRSDETQELPEVPPQQLSPRADRTSTGRADYTRFDLVDEAAETRMTEVPPGEVEETRVSARPPVDPEETSAYQPDMRPGLKVTGLSTGGGQERYEPLERLGAGAMGEVHLARDRDLRRKVAFKRMHRRVANDPQQAARFFTEVQITAQLEHPNIVPVYALEVTDDGQAGYAMKLLHGKTLKNLIDETRKLLDDGKPLDEPHSLAGRLDYFLMVCDAMAFAHSKGVIHRDLKPANVMLGEYHQVYVVDWGICRMIGDDATEKPHDEQVEIGQELASATQTQCGTAIGTPCYMSPEQAHGRNHELDDRSDLFSLGLILYELIALRRAYQGDTTVDVWNDVCDGKLQPLVNHPGEGPVPGDLRAIVEKATARNPVDRYPDVSYLAEDVRRYLHGDEVSVRPDNAVRKLMRWMTRHRVATLSAMIVILALGAGATIAALVHAHVALQAAAHREHQMNQLLTAVAAQSHRLDNQFADYELELTRLSGRAAVALSAPEPAENQHYLAGDFEQADRRPPDTAEAERFHTAISTQWPVFKLAPGVTPQSADDDLRRLGTLGDALRDSVLASAGKRAGPPEEVRQQIVDTGAPFRWVYVSLADGVHCGYPGKGGYPPGYDGRQRPFYKLSANQPGLHWGQPYLDALGQGLLVPCSTAVYDAQHQFRGVAGFDLTLEYLIDDLLNIEGYPYIDASYLVEPDGDVVVDSIERGGHYEQADGALKLKPLPYPEVIAALGKQPSGHVELTAPQHKVVVYYLLHSVGWYYVVVADVNKMLVE